jgi:hypothetical protein
MSLHVEWTPAAERDLRRFDRHTQIQNVLAMVSNKVNGGTIKHLSRFNIHRMSRLDAHHY